MPDTAVLAPGATAVGPPWFSCRRSDCASTARLIVSGELDIATAPQLAHTLGCAQADAALVILDLRELQFMDSSGANLIEAASGRARQASDRLVVVGGPVQVERIFALVGLDRQLEGRDRPRGGDRATAADRRSARRRPAPRGGGLERGNRAGRGDDRPALRCAALADASRRDARDRRGPPRVRRVLELCAIDGVELHQSVSAARPAAVATPRGAPPLNPSTSNK